MTEPEAGVEYLLTGTFQQDGSFGWKVALPAFTAYGASSECPRSSLQLMEDGAPLGPSDQMHDDIRAHGQGRYSHWKDQLWFATSDGSDPNTNGRAYSIILTGKPNHEPVPAPKPAEAAPAAGVEEPRKGVSYRLTGPFSSDGALAWTIALPGFAAWAASEGQPSSSMQLMEDGVRIGPGDEPHDDVRRLGHGRYSHWKHQLWFSTTDGSDPNSNGRTYTILFQNKALSGPSIPYETLDLDKGVFAVDLPRPFNPDGGHCWQVGLPALEALGSNDHYHSELCLIEDGVPLARAESFHDPIRTLGGGRYSHWGSGFWFSTTDNSDPNTNGRRYQIGYKVHTTLPDGSVIYQPALRPYMLRRNGRNVALPQYCNIGLTNKCNLRCEICGSQKYIEDEKISRRFMDIDAFRRMAETVLPFMAEVELSSYGEPSLHPHFEEVLTAIRDHGCVVKLQTNATLLTDRVVSLLAGMTGAVWMSIDATGPLFNEVRRFGKWENVERGVRRLNALRDPDRLKLCVNPTVTRRSMPAMLDVLEWAHANGVDSVNFRKYDPIVGSSEEQPSSSELAPYLAALADWADRHPDGPDVRFEPDWIRRTGQHGKEGVNPALYKVPKSLHPNYPVPIGRPDAHPEFLCMAPLQYVELGLDGEMYACCRTQRTVLGYATSIDEFLDAWCGKRYESVRQSLRHESLNPIVLPECAGCIKSYCGRSTS